MKNSHSSQIPHRSARAKARLVMVRGMRPLPFFFTPTHEAMTGSPE